MSNTAQNNEQTNMAKFIDVPVIAKNNNAITAITITFNSDMINRMRPANATEQGNYSGAQSVIRHTDINYNQPTLDTYVSTLTVAAIKALIVA